MIGSDRVKIAGEVMLLSATGGAQVLQRVHVG